MQSSSSFSSFFNRFLSVMETLRYGKSLMQVGDIHPKRKAPGAGTSNRGSIHKLFDHFGYCLGPPCGRCILEELPHMRPQRTSGLSQRRFEFAKVPVSLLLTSLFAQDPCPGLFEGSLLGFPP